MYRQEGSLLHSSSEKSRTEPKTSAPSLRQNEQELSHWKRKYVCRKQVDKKTEKTAKNQRRSVFTLFLFHQTELSLCIDRQKVVSYLLKGFTSETIILTHCNLLTKGKIWNVWKLGKALICGHRVARPLVHSCKDRCLAAGASVHHMIDLNMIIG